MKLNRILTILLIILVIEYSFISYKVGLISDTWLTVIDLSALILGFIKEWILKDKNSELLESIVNHNKTEDERIQKESEAKNLMKLKNNFFNPLLSELEIEDNKYFKIGSMYSKELKKMMPLEPIELKFSDKIINNPNKYNQLLNDCIELKNITIDFNKDLANFFEEIRVIVKKEIDLPYWCAHPQSDEPYNYLCHDAFIRAIYEEVKYRSKTERKVLHGIGEIRERIFPDTKVWYFRWGEQYLAVSSEKERVEKAQLLFGQFIVNEKYKEIIKAFLEKKKKTYDVALEKIRQDIKKIIEPIESDNITPEVFINPY